MTEAGVVGAEAEAHLQDLEAVGGGFGLDVFYVVEDHAGDGEGLEGLDAGGLFQALLTLLRGGEMGGEGEAGEAAGLGLEGAEGFEVSDALLGGLTEAEEHGGGGTQAEEVGGAVEVEPLGGEAEGGLEDLAGFVVQDGGVFAGDGVEAGVFEAGEEEWEVGGLGEVE